MGSYSAQGMSSPVNIEDEKDALVEFQDHLDDRVSENQAYRLIKFSGGRRTEGWWKNKLYPLVCLVDS